ncbi:hypothetical protein D7V93_17015 [Corallococcus llansteffanensis]|uniref:Uncharacterized protein n=1 Tax=Corallococcus llansteffanensis TaxID=2316731 RepID=A0A3A8PPN4_9BACT|nr:hypothetical protein D7V93_17015 [Corallococcus llansteffanensis]
MESHGWKQVDANTLKFETANGRTYTLTAGDAPLRARADALTKSARDLSKAEQAELAFLTEALGAAATVSSVSQQHCNGVLDFDPQFFYGMADGAAQMTVSWSEFVPYVPIQQRITAFAQAFAPGLTTVSDSEGTGWFQGSPYQTVTAYAGIGPTFSPSFKVIGYYISGNTRTCPSYTFQQNG